MVLEELTNPVLFANRAVVVSMPWIQVTKKKKNEVEVLFSSLSGAAILIPVVFPDG